MSSKGEKALLIEWSPSCVRATISGSDTEITAPRIADLGAILGGVKKAVIGIGHSHVFLKAVRLPKTNRDDLRKIIAVQIGTYFPIPASQLSFDFIQTNDIEHGIALTVVVAVRNDDLALLHADLKKANIKATRVLPICFGATGIVAKGGYVSGLFIEQHGHGISFDVVNHGVVIFSRYTASYSDLQTEVRRTLAASQSDTLPLILSGDIDLPNATQVNSTELSALAEAPDINFLMEEERQRIAKSHLASRNRLAILMLIAAMLFVLIVWQDRQDAQAKVNQKQGAKTRELTMDRSILNSEMSKAEQVIAIQNSLDTAFSPGQTLSDVSSVIVDSLPKDTWLTGLTAERGKPVTIRGVALHTGSVGRIVDSLGSNPRFRDVRLVFANASTISTTSVINFDISAVCVGNLPLPQPPKVRPIIRPVTTATSNSSSGGLQ